MFQIDYTIGTNSRENPYHIPIVRLQLTQALPLLVPEVYDEVVMTFNDFIPITEGKRLNHQKMFKNKLDNSRTEWQSVRVMDTMMKIVCRASNRIFVGLPLCTWLLSLDYYVLSFAGRNSDYVNLNVQFTVDVIKTAFILRMVPGFLKP
jgi:hypothetical protein